MLQVTKKILSHLLNPPRVSVLTINANLMGHLECLKESLVM